MSTWYYNHPSLSQNQETLVNDSFDEQKGSSFRIASMPTLQVEHDEELDIEDEESEFKMGRLIRQASFNSSHMSPPPQQTTKVMKGSSSLPRYLSQKEETNKEKVSNMRKFESMRERNRSKNSMKMGKNNGGAPTIPGGWVDKGSSEDMKAQIKFWARAVAFNVHQEC
ncbi:uncharacterized protein [Rutidosis leptorrhynchoides]|uniref:uncharacterized protein n=1 Tax=Rutidosis leptorrhynchoides TaxID=125765 RepID=UPI003A99C7EC